MTWLWGGTTRWWLDCGCVAASVVAAMATSMSERLLSVPIVEVGSGLLHNASNITQHLSQSVLQQPLDWTDTWTYILPALVVALSYLFYAIMIRPLDRVRLLGDVGYIPEMGHKMKDMANIVRKRRQAGDVPPVYPNGWFVILESRDVAVGESKAVSCLGLQLAVFRDESGHVHVVDAYCPHMGANLGVGGNVRGNCIECPFHGWRFRGDDGKCVHVPYSEDKYIPENANIKSHISVERNQQIHIWYHAEGAEPYWEVPNIEQIASGAWAYRGRTEHHVNAHIEEVPENGADVAHLNQVHGPCMAAGIDLRYVQNKMWSFIKHTWKGSWDIDPDSKHIGTLNVLHRLSVLGKEIGILDLQVRARQIGPGIVHMWFESAMGNGAFIHSVTPIEPLQQRVVHNMFMHWAVPTVIGKFYLLAEALQVDRDMMIWNNKCYVSKPVFVKSAEDALVAKHRRWYAQFYSEHSPRLKIQKDTLDW